MRLSAVVGETIRGEDIFARYGGEEFAVILRECPEDVGAIIGERIRRLVEATNFTFNDKRIPVTVSIGVACLAQRNFAGPDELIAAADELLYAAKRNGRNRVERNPKANPTP
jgi:diguanylate cyclase (GGDEF)-like protein